MKEPSRVRRIWRTLTERLSAPFRKTMDPESLSLRRIEATELSEILTHHQKWLESDGRFGVQANLESTDLSGANLEQAQLRSAKLAACDLRFANLRRSDLSGATGLLPRALAGSDLTGARLPSETNWDSALQVAEKEAASAAHLFGIQIFACCYSLLTIAFTRDVMLFGGLSPTPLPIIQVPVSMTGFYLVVPILLLGLYLSFHFQLGSFMEAVAELPAFFPDGRSVRRKVYFSTLFEAPRRKYQVPCVGRPKALERVYTRLASFLIWWLLPLTLIAFRAKYLPKHDPIGTTLHGVLVIAAWAFAFLLRAATVRRLDPASAKSRAGWRRITVKGIGAFAVLLFLAWGHLTVSPWAFFDQIASHDLAHDLFDADLQGAALSIKPSSWTGEQLEAVKGARLRGVDLRRANLIGAFLVKADLVGADLREAVFNNSDLRNAVLNSADLQKAHLSSANLTQASLIFAQLQQANLREAVLRGANLQCANLEDAHLFSADFGEADLRNAKLSGKFIMNADFSGATFGSMWLNFPRTDLRGADLRFARGLSVEQLKQALLDQTTLLPKGLKDELLASKP